ncbi:hypothetical protein Gohar_010646 [Gossypium harknessii]|uniref:Trehalose-6-phosphate synthase n=1 Tax=Gossypium harknessii TaxID=34285 RepID=A0A7J9GRI8_9ROSI|nr:hypothetical protein [Gossypium harknessii]
MSCDGHEVVNTRKVDWGSNIASVSNFASVGAVAIYVTQNQIVPDEIGRKVLTEALAEKRCIPVFLDEEIVHQYYNGSCNNMLWPLFHYLRLPQDNCLATTRSFQSQFDAYKKVNKLFADVVNEHYEEGDVVWCHDYHLMFLPKYLKEWNSKMKVGWFLHTHFLLLKSIGHCHLDRSY